MNTYQVLASETAIYPGEGEIEGLSYVVLGLNGESGELAEQAKKILRSPNTADERRELMKKELGDVLWYVAMVAKELNISLSEVAKQNVQKLSSRQDRGVLRGDGGDR